MKLIVNGETIPISQIEAEVQLLRPEYQKVFAHQTRQEQEEQLWEWAKENVIEKVLLRQMASNDARKIPQHQVEKAFPKLLAGHGGEQNFAQKYINEKAVETKIKQKVELQLKIERLINELCENLPRPTKKQAYQFYLKNKSQYISPEQVHAAHIVKNINAFKSESQAKKEILEIQNQLARGNSFETLAEEQSDCLENSGDLGYFPRGRLVQNFDDVVFSLKKNQISEVFRTEFGYHLAKVYDKKPAQLIPFEQIKGQIFSQLSEENRRARLEHFLDEIRQKANIEYIPPTVNEQKSESPQPKFANKKITPTHYAKQLPSILIKPTGPDCNMACTYCFYLEKQKLFAEKKVHRMNEEILEETIKQALQQGGREISFSWQGGEPTLMGIPFYQKVVELQQKYSRGQIVGNGLQTNGLLINKDWAQFLKKHNFLVGISIDGPEHVHNYYRKLSNGQKSWQRVIDNAKLLLDSQVNVNVLSVVNNYSVNFAQEIYAHHKTLGLNWMQFIPIVETDVHDCSRVAPFSVAGEKYGEFLIQLFDLWQADFTTEDLKTSIRFFDSIFFSYVDLIPPDCSLLKECGVYLVVEHNGDLFSCDFFVEPEWKLGNILEDNLLDILNSERQNAFGREKSNLSDQCKNCPWLRFCFGGCPKDRQRNPGDKNLSLFCQAHKMLFEHAHPTFLQIAEDWKRLHCGDNKSDQIRHLAKKGELKIGRNDPCPCGSGKKFKKCCGIA